MNLGHVAILPQAPPAGVAESAFASSELAVLDLADEDRVEPPGTGHVLTGAGWRRRWVRAFQLLQALLQIFPVLVGET
ncbi:hypothetical protein SAMN05661093_11008 [Kibdelosporangium aridum]|uniref:Uncharacterized protein n=1 Tax=Kibdelosporangium aridum TaxID=2030 RepID=A0A1W2FZS9_KIBAR|nr:hypothetical protein SAMN05661093_11008 [Kibdelosporangium aridum]